MQLPLNPIVKLVPVPVERGLVMVADDSALPGGTKQRAAIPFLQELQHRGINEFVYASPFSGYAQIALARSCQAIGARCTIIAESVNGEMSTFTKAIADLASVELCITLAEAEARSSQLKTAFKIPLGFDHPRYKLHLRKALASQWQHIKDTMDPQRLWLPVGSGTLLATFREVVGKQIEIFAVDVGVLPDSDKRIQAAQLEPRYMRVPELFRERVKQTPPITSNVYYDAKLWQFVNSCGRTGDLWWNVAG